MIQAESNKNYSNKQQTNLSQNFSQSQQSPSILEDTEWLQLKLTIKNKYELQAAILAQQQCFIQQQTQAITDLVEQMNKKKQRQTFNSSMDMLPIQTSFSNISAVYNIENDDSFFKSKFAEQFQRSLVSSVLKEVEQMCSAQTYQSVKNYIMNNKQKQYQNAQFLIKKLTQQKQEIRTSLIIKSNQLSHCQSKLALANSKIQTIEEEKKRIKIKNDRLMEKQKRIHKAQMSLIFKEKISFQGKKRYQRQKSLFLQIEQRLKKLYEQMNDIWESICKKMEEASKIGCIQTCQEGKNSQCWKKQVMKKCKNQLLDQRNLLKQEQAEIQKQYDMMHLLSEQMRKMANDQQFNSNSQSSIFSIAEQKI